MMDQKLRDVAIDDAKELINGDRQDDYGDAYEMHADIAKGWNYIIGEAIESDGGLTPAHVALMMDWLKTCRALRNMTGMDSWVDKIGYSALGFEMARERATRDMIRDGVEVEVEDEDGTPSDG